MCQAPITELDAARLLNRFWADGFPYVGFDAWAGGDCAGATWKEAHEPGLAAVFYRISMFDDDNDNSPLNSEAIDAVLAYLNGEPCGN